MKNLKKVISIAGISVLFVINLANTVAAAKQNSASNIEKTALYIANFGNKNSCSR
jgi:hypothetical protein